MEDTKPDYIVHDGFHGKLSGGSTSLLVREFFNPPDTRKFDLVLSGEHSTYTLEGITERELDSIASFLRNII